MGLYFAHSCLISFLRICIIAPSAHWSGSFSPCCMLFVTRRAIRGDVCGSFPRPPMVRPPSPLLYCFQVNVGVLDVAHVIGLAAHFPFRDVA